MVPNLAENLEIRTHEANTQVEARHYAFTHHFPDWDRELLFLLNLSKILAKSPQYKQNWLELCASCIAPPEPMPLDEEDILSTTAPLHPYFQLLVPKNPYMCLWENRLSQYYHRTKINILFLFVLINRTQPHY